MTVHGESFPQTSATMTRPLPNLPTLEASIFTPTCDTGNSTSFYKQPPGFKEPRERVNKFAGDGKEDFDVWVADYCEATGNCGWTDELRAQWFSWFLTESAKHT